MERNRWLVPLTGAAFFVLAAAGFIIGGEPKNADHAPREIANWYIDNKDSVFIGVVILAASLILLVFFGAYLRSALRTASGGADVLPLVAFIGTVVAAVGFAFDLTIAIALADRADNISPVAVQALQALWDNDFIPIVLGVELFLWATGLAAIRTGALPKWLGWILLVLAVIGLTPIGFVAAIGAALAILVISILLAMRERAGAVRTPMAADRTSRIDA